jgi:hypothetical protein
MFPFDDTLGRSAGFAANGSCDEVNFHCRAPLALLPGSAPPFEGSCNDSSKMHAKFFSFYFPDGYEVRQVET